MSLQNPPVVDDVLEPAARAYDPLRAVPFATVRARLAPERYERSVRRAMLWWLIDLAIYAAIIGAIYRAQSPILKLGLGALAGLAVSMMFVWAHDAAHGSLFRNTKVADGLGLLLMLPSLNVYRLWQLGHNRIHHGFTSLVPLDWIWRPLSPAEYLRRPRWRRVLYRVERSLPGCGVHYLVQVWWRAMIRFRPDQGSRGAGYLRGKLVTLAFVAVASASAYRFAGGAVGVLGAVLIPFLVFTWVIALVVYLHHTHPDIPFFSSRAEWTRTIAQLHCSTVIRTTRVTTALTHNILVHVPHHVDARIPFYNLRAAYEDLRPAFGELIHEYPFRWRTVRGIFRDCKLYDFANHNWHTFADAADLARRMRAEACLPTS